MSNSIVNYYKGSTNNFLLRLTTLLIAVSFILDSLSPESFRYTKYAVVLIPILFGRTSYFKKNNVINSHYFNSFIFFYVGIFAFYFVLQSLSIIEGNERFFQECFFILAPLMTVAFSTGRNSLVNIEKVITSLFYSIIICFFLEGYRKGTLASLTSFSFNLLIREFILSELDTESTLSFLFGFFSIFFFINGKTIKCLVAFLFLLLSFKRIAIFGSGAIIIFYYIFSKPSFQNGWKRSAIILIGFLNFFIPFFSILTANGRYDLIINNVFGVSTDQLLQGRDEIYKLILWKFNYPTFFGIGTGVLNSFLTKRNVSNVHSDLLKNLYEFGFLFYFIWVILLYRYIVKKVNFAGVCFTLYLNILFISDNVFIYYSVMVIFYLFMSFTFIRLNDRGVVLNQVF